MPPHLVVDVTGHGYGHAAMTFPVLEALHATRPDVRVTIRSTLPRAWLATRLAAPFDHRVEEDFGMAMEDAFHVRAMESLDRYRAIHADWPRRVEEAASRLSALSPDLLVSNISYLSLAAARRAGVRALAYSSLNWADLFHAYCGALPGAAAIRAEMAEAYAAAEVFLQPRPSMEMPSVANGRPVGPVARVGRNRSEALRAALGLDRDVGVVGLSMGGVATPIRYADWPRLPGLRVVVGSDEEPDHPDVSSWVPLGMPFIDLLSSCDAMIVKPGYGLFTECACNGVPLLYAPRDKWPETPAQEAWLARHGVGLKIAEATLRAGAIAAPLRRLLARERPPRCRPDGIGDVVSEILQRLPV